MKIRQGFVSNSSSSSFIINNKSGKEKTLIDFVLENKYLIDDFNSSYSDDIKLSSVIANAEEREMLLKKGSHEYVFGDEDGDDLGRVFDYILREDGESENFEWWYHDSYR